MGWVYYVGKMNTRTERVSEWKHLTPGRFFDEDNTVLGLFLWATGKWCAHYADYKSLAKLDLDSANPEWVKIEPYERICTRVGSRILYSGVLRNACSSHDRDWFLVRMQPYSGYVSPECSIM